MTAIDARFALGPESLREVCMNVAIQIGPIGPIDIEADTTFRLAEKAQARGVELFHHFPVSLFWEDGQIAARGWRGSTVSAMPESNHVTSVCNSLQMHQVLGRNRHQLSP